MLTVERLRHMTNGVMKIGIAAKERKDRKKKRFSPHRILPPYEPLCNTTGRFNSFMRGFCQRDNITNFHNKVAKAAKIRDVNSSLWPLRPCCENSVFVCVRLADVAKGGDGAKSGSREISVWLRLRRAVFFRGYSKRPPGAEPTAPGDTHPLTDWQ